eukprot:GHVR01171523.1.p1 GENE.GHVR01171523.1~~GHVR01171523.1.p1  ORF type:complete len:243 (+),score=63.33 GHVR01171523.1:150-878(+)
MWGEGMGEYGFPYPNVPINVTVDALVGTTPDEGYMTNYTINCADGYFLERNGAIVAEGCGCVCVCVCGCVCVCVGECIHTHEHSCFLLMSVGLYMGVWVNRFTYVSVCVCVNAAYYFKCLPSGNWTWALDTPDEFCQPLKCTTPIDTSDLDRWGIQRDTSPPDDLPVNSTAQVQYTCTGDRGRVFLGDADQNDTTAPVTFTCLPFEENSPRWQYERSIECRNPCPLSGDLETFTSEVACPSC